MEEIRKLGLEKRVGEHFRGRSQTSRSKSDGFEAGLQSEKLSLG